MKKIINVLLSFLGVLIFMLSVIPVYAAENNNDIGITLTESDANKIVSYSRTADISAVIESQQQKVSEGYYSYTLLSPDIVTSVEKGAKLKNLISEKYCMIVPTEKGYVKYLKDNNGDISYVGEAIFKESSKNTDIVNISTVKSIVSTAKYADAADMVVFDATMYHTSFVYFVANDVEYLIPFGSRTDLTGLENGKVYEATDCLSKLSATWGGTTADGDRASNGNGGNVDSIVGTTNIIRNAVIFGVILALFAFAGVVAFYSIRKAKKIK